jgi:hypothetical protein
LFSAVLDGGTSVGITLRVPPTTWKLPSSSTFNLGRDVYVYVRRAMTVPFGSMEV